MREELEGLLRSGELQAVVAYATDWWNRRQSDSEIAWAAVSASKALALQGQWGESLVWAQRGLDLRPGDTEATFWLHFVLGTAHMYVGDPFEAKANLLKALDLFPAIPSLDRVLPDLYFNLGFAEKHLLRDAEELHYLNLALAAYEQRNRQHMVIVCLLEIAWHHMERAAVREGMPALQAATAALELSPDTISGHDASLCWALYHQATGNLEESDRICRRLRTAPGVLQRQVADAVWIQGTNALASGDTVAALRLAQEARRLALAERWPLQLRRIQRLQDSLALGRTGH